jgi:hypothetical protein
LKIPVNLAHGLARVLVRRHELNLGVRVKEQYAKKLRAAVARPAEDAYSQS